MTNLNIGESFIDAPLTIFGSTLTGAYSEPLNPPNFRILSLPRGHALSGIAVPWEITLDDARGVQVQSDKFEKAYAGWSTSTADPRFRGHLFNPAAITRESQSFGGTAGDGPVVWVNAGPSLGTVMAQGTTANRCLARAITTLSPAPTYVTYDPGGAITSLMSGPLNGTTNYLLIGRENATIDLHTTVGTSAATMHANLTACWGGAISPTDSAVAGTPAWLFYANNGIWKLSTTAAVNATPTQTYFNLPNGGCVLGFDKLEKSPLDNRMWMLLPEINRSTSCWDDPGVTPARTRLASCNADGLDVIEEKLPCAGIYFGRLWQRRVVVSDSARIIQYDGERAIDLNIFGNVLLPSSSYKALVVGLNGDDACLRALVQIGDTNGNITVQWWEYNEETRGWSPVSAQSADISNAASSNDSPYIIDRHMVLYGPNLPYSRANALQWVPFYNSGDVTWERQQVWPRGVNPNLHFKTTESSSIHTWPEWILPGRLSAVPFTISEIDGRLLNLEDGGTGATSLVEVAVQSSPTSSTLTFTNTPTKVTFQQVQGLRDRVYRPAQASGLQRLQVRETLTAGSAATKSPDGLPLVIRGVSFMDGQVRSPREAALYV